jgi:sigma-B regulation protein RsbU (phosphoserine phosphatase)
VASIDQLKVAIDEAKGSFEADSCTFYIQDPWWPEDLRLLFMPGVTIQEPMHGFLMPLHSKDRIMKGEEIELIDDARADSRMTDKDLPQTLARLTRTKPIFGNFALREGVHSYARLIFQKSHASAHASLFLNYITKKTKASLEEMRPRLKQLLEELWPLLSGLGEELKSKDPLPIQRLLRILDTTKQLTEIGSSNIGTTLVLKKFFNKLLKTILDVHSIGQDGFGSIYRFDPDTEDLSLYASFPETIELPSRQSCRDGDGTIAWVALKGRPVLIADVEKSEFLRQGVYRKVRPGILSEIALPMLVNEKVVGVLNIESSRGDAFKPEDVRVLWYAANHAATALHLAERVNEYNTLAKRITELLEVCKETVTKGAGGSLDNAATYLNRLASLFAEWAGADMCDIWGYDRKKDEFWGAGASAREINVTDAPRKLGKGFSRFVIQQRTAVFINNIRNEQDFAASLWLRDSKSWGASSAFPDTVSPALTSLKVEAEIGIPITCSGYVIGVAWLKFRKSTANPSLELMSHVEGLAASIALVMEVLQKYDESVRSSEELFKRRLIDYGEKLFPPKLPDMPGMQVCIRYEPAGGTIGGDFYGFHEWSQPRRVAFVLGDGEGHGIEGALEMLPLYTAFRILCPGTTSTHYVLEKMGEVARGIQVRGTALYFIIDMPETNKNENESDDWIVSASVAGNAPPLMIFDARSGDKREIPSERKLFQTNLGVDFPPPLGEALTTCKADEVMVAVTDGILDAGIKDEGKSPFDRLGVSSAVMSVLRKNRPASPKEIVDAIFEQAHAHGTIHDDVTAIVIRRGSQRHPSC